MDISSSINNLLQSSELQVAEHFNISTAVLRTFRADTLTEAADWQRGKYNKVYFTAAGLSRIMEWLGLKTKTAECAAVEVTVAGFPPNPHILKCLLEDGTAVNVKVRSQVGFLKGMKITTRTDPGSSLLVYKGPNPCNPKMERHFYTVGKQKA